jgi:hypothetical protein
MLVFLTSIRHPQNSNNFAKVEKLFEISLRSVCAQTDSNFSVVVVCNAKPRIEYDDPRVIYHIVDFPAPSADRVAGIKLNLMLRDKGFKLVAGMLRARTLDPSYFMIFDADDLVSRRTAAFVNARPGTPGWYVDGAYVINYATKRVQRKHGLVRFCGTSLVPSARELYRLARIDSACPVNCSQDEIMAMVPPGFIEGVIGNHKYMVGYFARHGLRMKPLPFRAAAWVLQTGENHGAFKGPEYGLPLSPWFVEEFGLTELTPDSAASATVGDRLWEAFGCTKSWFGSLRLRLVGHPDVAGS